ncbi:uncharacterized protein RHIMIDRAFT_309933 [Rhizopus microsporus ATCC 52813]|uniref:Uncharacterized protein n=1 Tax=Rhizopus microsporus ATCC 52813 TaxID=1340429 RepID=A0A2G4T7V4_RHIZD|nr:uncharacterized protein RHIMIDRAFT_309933 [Rhizopus microsporus ATCC 52813]PHZ17102.1 hypothetical protein RHIMIDRAFT_309933 [Rhizopus microsporus ATCC 52813]
MAAVEEEDINNLYLPFEMRPGTDLTSKLILNNKTVINIIVHHLLGINIPNNAYLSGSTEWADGKRSDALYIPRNGVTHDLPPILIEVQNCIDQLFMIRLINYCAHVYERYEVLPVVLVFVVKKFSNTTFEEKFVKKANVPYILETQCEFWAKSTNFVSAKSIENFAQDSMDPFVALAYFTISQTQDLKSLTFAADMTVRFLYSICQKNMKKKNKSELDQVFDQATNQMQKIVELQDEDPILMLEKSKKIAKEFLETIQGQKRKLNEEYELDLQASQEQQQKYTREDFLFIESMSEPNKPKSWRKIFNAGKAKGLFNSYTSANSLKSSYHHAVKRAKKQK